VTGWAGGLPAAPSRQACPGADALVWPSFLPSVLTACSRLPPLPPCRALVPPLRSWRSASGAATCSSSTRACSATASGGHASVAVGSWMLCKHALVRLSCCTPSQPLLASPLPPSCLVPCHVSTPTTLTLRMPPALPSGRHVHARGPQRAADGGDHLCIHQHWTGIRYRCSLAGVCVPQLHFRCALPCTHLRWADVTRILGWRYAAKYNDRLRLVPLDAFHVRRCPCLPRPAARHGDCHASQRPRARLHCLLCIHCAGALSWCVLSVSSW